MTFKDLQKSISDWSEGGSYAKDWQYDMYLHSYILLQLLQLYPGFWLV